MQRAVAAVVVVAAVMGAACGRASSSPAGRPQLRLMDSSPLTLSGTGFRSGEHVRVVQRTPGLITKRVTAGSSGSFTVRFTSAAHACTALSIVATGDRGSKAAYWRPPEHCGALP